MPNMPLLAAVPLLLAGSAFAAEPEDLLDLDLAALLQVEVLSGSGRGEALQRSPGVIRVFERADIERAGYRSLRDLLLQIPGAQIAESKNGHALVYMRGVQSRNNNKLLLLVDGLPQQDGYYGNFHLDALLPLAVVERVEVLNGPGGVLYGANSFVGIINVSTRSAGNELALAGGRHGSYRDGDSGHAGHWQARAQYAYEGLFLYADRLRDDGFQPLLGSAGLPQPRQNFSEQRDFLLLKYRHGKLALQLQAADYRYPYRFHGSPLRERGYAKRPVQFSLDYHGELGGGEYALQAYGNDYRFQRPGMRWRANGSVSEISESNHSALLSGLGASWRRPFGEQRWLTLGLAQSRNRVTDDQEHRFAFDAQGRPSGERHFPALVFRPEQIDDALFVQYQDTRRPLAQWTVGLRRDWLRGFDDQTSYRLGLTGARGAWFYKALVGSSFRVPLPREYLKSYLGSDRFNTLLQPERIRTAELQVGWQRGAWMLDLVAYRNDYRDYIQEFNVLQVDDLLVGEGGGDEYAFNFDRREVVGSEFSLTWRPSARWQANLSWSHLLRAREEPGQLRQVVVAPVPIPDTPRDIPFLSRDTLTLRLDAELGRGIGLGLQATRYGTRSVTADYQRDSAVQAPGNRGAFTLLAAHLRWQARPEWDLGLRVDNLTDARIYSPVEESPWDYDAQWPRRRISLELRYRF